MTMTIAEAKICVATLSIKANRTQAENLKLKGALAILSNSWVPVI